MVAILADDHTAYWAELWPSCKKSYTPPSPSFHKLVRFYHEKWLVSELMIKPLLTYSNHANQEMLLCFFLTLSFFTLKTHTEHYWAVVIVKAHSWSTSFFCTLCTYSFFCLFFLQIFRGQINPDRVTKKWLERGKTLTFWLNTITFLQISHNRFLVLLISESEFNLVILYWQLQ